MKYSYDPEGDLLAITLENTPFEFAEEVGDFIVHFDKKNRPVYVEILNASRFLANASTKLPKSAKKELSRHLHAT